MLVARRFFASDGSLAEHVNTRHQDVQGGGFPRKVNGLGHHGTTATGGAGGRLRPGGSSIVWNLVSGIEAGLMDGGQGAHLF